MKPWQHGIELDYLKSQEAFYEPFNRHALSVFGKFKKNDIATKIDEGTYHRMKDCAYVLEESKVPSKITMHSKTIIAAKHKGDLTFSRLVGDLIELRFAFHSHHYEEKNCFIVAYAAQNDICFLAESLGFKKLGHKVTSFAEILAIYYRDSDLSFDSRQHPEASKADLVAMAQVRTADPELLQTILHKLQTLDPKFTNHYSNYNTMNAWSALSLRGYSADPGFIIKPAEMNDKWLAQHKDDNYFLQDTPLYARFPEVRQLLSFLDGEVHRVRFMQLAPGGGELQRHTDQVDPDAGNSLGAVARLHFPLVTNPKVVFSTWNEFDKEENYHFGYGEVWVIDTRKPHKAVNGGQENRIHLVVDVIVTPKLEKMIMEGDSRRV